MHEEFFTLHGNLPRQGPGSDESTMKALHAVTLKTHSPSILDIGCGPGMQTRCLARVFPNGSVIAVDTHKPFLAELDEACANEQIYHVTSMQASMCSLPFAEESFDLIWSEGAVYIMGFAQGLKAWRSLLKPGGYLAVTEVSWIQSSPPAYLKEFWAHEYPAMTDVQGNISHILDAGYQIVDNFSLPAEDWYTHYYNPLGKRIRMLRSTYPHDESWQEFLNLTEQEIALFDIGKAWYAYVFYIMRKPEE